VKTKACKIRNISATTPAHLAFVQGPVITNGSTPEKAHRQSGQKSNDSKGHDYMQSDPEFREQSIDHRVVQQYDGHFNAPKFGVEKR